MKLLYETGAKFHFVVDTHRSAQVRALLQGLGARTIESAHCFLHVFGVHFPLPETGTLVSGYFVADGAFIKGPCLSPRVPNGAGDWIALDYSAKGVEITADAFASASIFFGKGLASNSLNLVERALRCQGRFATNRSALASFFMISGAFCKQSSTFATPIDGIETLQAGAKLEIGRKIKVVKPELDHSLVCADEYWHLLEQGAAEIAETTQAVISGVPVASAALTGGRDSRVVYGAILATGKQNDVRFNTLDIGRDLEIAKSILGTFGGRFGSDMDPFDEGVPSVRHRALWDAVEAVQSHHYFSYHAIHKLIRMQEVDRQYPMVLMGGGGGECYRAFYREQVRKIKSLGRERDGGEFAQLLYWIERAARASHASTELIIPEQVKTLTRLAGHGHAATFAGHYLNFRNKHQFNNKIQIRKIGFAPLQNATLLALSRRVPKQILDGGHILSDLTSVFSGALARHEYDKPWPKNRAAHPFARGGAQQGAEIPADPGSYVARGHAPAKVAAVGLAPMSKAEMAKVLREDSIRVLDTLGDDELVGLPRDYVQAKLDGFAGRKDAQVFAWHSMLNMLHWYRPA